MNAWSRQELEVYEYWQLRDAADRYGMEEKYDKGKIDGKIEGKIEVARNMRAIGVEIGLIMQATGLSRKEIEGE